MKIPTTYDWTTLPALTVSGSDHRNRDKDLRVDAIFGLSRRMTHLPTTCLVIAHPHTGTVGLDCYRAGITVHHTTLSQN